MHLQSIPVARHKKAKVCGGNVDSNMVHKFIFTRNLARLADNSEKNLLAES